MLCLITFLPTTLQLSGKPRLYKERSMSSTLAELCVWKRLYLVALNKKRNAQGVKIH